MIGTLYRLGKPPGVLLAQPGPPVATDVVVGSENAPPIAQYNDAFRPDLLQKILARLPDLVLPADAKPAAHKDLLELRCKHLGSNVVAAGKGSGAANSDLGRFEKLGHHTLYVSGWFKYGRRHIAAEDGIDADYRWMVTQAVVHPTAEAVL